MKTKRKKFRFIAAILSIVLLVSVFQGIPGQNFSCLDRAPRAKAAGYDTKVNEFINDARWKNGVSWPQISPKLSSYSSLGC